MNEVIKQLYDRKSVRAFLDKEIDEEIVQEILCSATMAPTAGNQQLYSIIRVRDQELLNRLADSCDHQPFIATGKLVLVFCADCLKWHQAFVDCGINPRSPTLGDLFIAIDDALIAAQNTVVAAESYGIGSCYIGDIMENIENLREILSLPKYVFPAALLVFGYPTEQQKERKKPSRVDIKYIVHDDKYKKLNNEELKDIFSRGRNDETYKESMKKFYNFKYSSDFSSEMTRSIKEYLKDFNQ